MWTVSAVIAFTLCHTQYLCMPGGSVCACAERVSVSARHPKGGEYLVTLRGHQCERAVVLSSMSLGCDKVRVCLNGEPDFVGVAGQLSGFFCCLPSALV